MCIKLNNEGDIELKLEVLVSTMNNENPENLYRKMNLNTDTIIINQNKKLSYNKFKKKNNNIQVYSFDEFGVGLSRNNALMRSSSTICIMADDDMKYVEGYEKIIENAYKKNKDADMIVFNVIVHKNGHSKNTVKKNKRVKFYNSLSYGTVMYTFKNESIKKKGITFSLLFGGGAKYGSGEDSLFIWDVLKSNLKIVSCEETIAEVYNDDSSWFRGYNEKFFYDKGALFKALTSRYYIFMIIQFLIRHKKLYLNSMSIKNAYQLMIKGAKEF